MTQTLPSNLHGFLDPNDAVAISFWIISITMVAAVHYFYMREFWVQIHMSPILYRYIDWSITVPLQMIEFYLILSACSKDISQASFWKLLIGTVIMLAAGYAGESGYMLGGAWCGFAVGLLGWFFILFE